MQLFNMFTIYYALGVALQLAASIHAISAYDHHSEENNHFQIDVDQAVDIVSCYLLVDVTIGLV
jgi:hypothetical protein